MAVPTTQASQGRAPKRTMVGGSTGFGGERVQVLLVGLPRSRASVDSLGIRRQDRRRSVRELLIEGLIDRLVHHCHLVTIRGNSYRMRQHRELWQTLHTAHEPESSGGPPPPDSGPSGGHDDLRLVPSSTCPIFTRRNCQILDRR